MVYNISHGRGGTELWAPLCLHSLHSGRGGFCANAMRCASNLSSPARFAENPPRTGGVHRRCNSCFRAPVSRHWRSTEDHGELAGQLSGPTLETRH